MEIKERIEAIKPYFENCCFADDRFVVVVKFGDNWTIPRPEMLTGKYGIAFEINQETGEGHFGIAMDGDYNVIFDIIDMIIKKNKENEAKRELLAENLKKLNALFEEEKQRFIVEKERLKSLFADKNNSLEFLRGVEVMGEARKSNVIAERQGKVTLNIEDDDSIESSSVVTTEEEPMSEIGATAIESVEKKETVTTEQEEVIPQAKRGRPAKNNGNSLLNKAMNLAKK